MIEENIIKIYNKILKKPIFSYLDVQKILKIKDLFFDLKNNNDISSDIELEFINNDVLFYEKIYDLLTEIDKRIIDNYLKSLPAEKYDFELMMNNKIKNQSSVSEISKIKIYVNKRNEFCKRINLNNYYEYICLKNNLNGNNIVIKKIRHFVKQNLSKIYAKFNLAHLNINFNNLYMCKLINFRDSLLDKEICYCILNK
jgi:hypothetical protein